MSGDGVMVEAISPDIPGNTSDIPGNSPDIPDKVDVEPGNSEDIQSPVPETAPEPANITDIEVVKRGRGRPKGAKNRPKPEIPREMTPPPRKRKMSPPIPRPPLCGPTGVEIATPEKPPSFADATRQWQQAERFATRSHYGSAIQSMFS